MMDVNLDSRINVHNIVSLAYIDVRIIVCISVHMNVYIYLVLYMYI